MRCPGGDLHPGRPEVSSISLRTISLLPYIHTGTSVKKGIQVAPVLVDRSPAEGSAPGDCNALALTLLWTFPARGHWLLPNTMVLSLLQIKDAFPYHGAAPSSLVSSVRLSTFPVDTTTLFIIMRIAPTGQAQGGFCGFPSPGVGCGSHGTDDCLGRKVV